MPNAKRTKGSKTATFPDSRASAGVFAVRKRRVLFHDVIGLIATVVVLLATGPAALAQQPKIPKPAPRPVRRPAVEILGPARWEKVERSVERGLDYLASRFVEKGWSVKSLHREILLSATYQLSTDHNEANASKDPENRWLWRANLRQRLDAEELRDSLLAVAGKLDLSMYGPPAPLTDSNRRRTIYGYVGRTQPDRMLSLFDFPNPNNMSEERTITVGPMQRLYFLNNDFVMQGAKAVAERLDAGSDEGKIGQAYQLLFGRPPTKPETGLGLDFLQKSGRAWPQYAQALLSSSEFSSVN